MQLNIDLDNWIKITRAATFVIVFALFTLNVTAQEGSPAYIDASQCRNITIDLVRVACYDALADHAPGQPPPTTEPAGPVQTEAAINRQLQEQNWRMREELARLRQGGSGSREEDRIGSYGKPGPRIEEEDDEEILYDRIAGLKKIPEGWVVTLESGQVWRQKENKRYQLSVGQEVKIAPSMWGAYHLSVSELGSFIYVERVK